MNTATTAAPALPETEDEQPVYTLAFWLAYVANVSLVTANALTFRFAEFVAWLGGSEQLAGTIVGTGVTAALVSRFLLGQAIDRYGVRMLWITSTILMFCGLSLFPLCSTMSWLIYVGRMAFAIGLAGMLTCSMVHIQTHVPLHRRTEVIGSLGTSGFVGMVLGTQGGDWIFSSMAPGRPQFLALFGTAASMAVFYLVIVLILTRNDQHDRPVDTPAAHRLLFRYWPGPVMFVAIMLGVGFTVTTVFLTRFATAEGLGGIGTFFTGYSVSAFFFRLASRRWSRIYGRHLMIVVGLAGQACGLISLPHVAANWQFLIPAFGCGLGHALLFPAVVSLGAGAFPQELRGSGTTLTLGFTELGALLSAPLLGTVIDYMGFRPMFYVAGITGLVIGTCYAITRLSATDEEAVPRARRRPVPQPARGPQPAVACCAGGHSVNHELRPDSGHTEDDLDDDEDGPRPDESIAWPFPGVGRNV